MADDQTAVSQWKPEDAVKNLKERIRLEFASMIPDQQFAAMVRSVIDDFLKIKESGYQRDRKSDFDSVVISELTEATKMEVKKFLASSSWQGKWDPLLNRNGVSEAIGNILQEKGTLILNAWIGQAIQEVIRQLQYNR